MRISDLQKKVNKTSTEKGFWDSYHAIDSLHEVVDLAVVPINDFRIKEYKEAEIAKKLALIQSEISEALEARRKGKTANIEEYMSLTFPSSSDEFNKTIFEKHIKDSFGDELADALIRIFDLGEELNIDLEFHVGAKMAYNATRERMHGKAY